MTSSARATRAVGFSALVLLAVNIYVFFDREWEASFSPTSYATLYYPLDIPTIRSWQRVERDRLQLRLACTQTVAAWQVWINGADPQEASGMSPSFRIDTTFDRLNTVRLIPVPEDACQPVEITVRFYPREFYASRGMTHTDVYIVRANVPCGEFDQLPLAAWIDPYEYVGAEARAETDRLLRDEAGIRDSDPTFTRMEKVVRFLRIKLKDARGVPKDDERWMNPWQLYTEMVHGTGKGWCTQHAQLYVYWANRAGIPTRFVFGARTQDNAIVYTGHAFAESFIREQQRWAFVDLSHAHITITDKNGLVLNTAELFHLNQHNAFDSTMARLYIDWEWQESLGIPSADTVVTVPFARCNAVVRGEFTPHAIMKYRRPPNVEDVRGVYTGFLRDWTFLTGNLERYLFKPQLAYSLYPTEGAGTYGLRRMLFFAMAGAFLVWLLLRIRQKKAA